GDVNGNAITSSLTAVEDRTAGVLVFDVEDRVVKAGEVFTVRFRADELVEGYQFTLHFPNLEVIEVTPLSEGMTLGHFGVFAEESAVTTSWDGEVLASFRLKFRAKVSGELSRMLQVSSRITRAEAYSALAGRQAVALRFNGVEGSVVKGVGFEVYQNTPNPWVSRTQIGFHVPESTEVVLTVFDESGRIVWTQRGQFAKGYNAFSIDRSLLEVPGVLYYRVETPTDSAVRKMIQLR
ncbi:MAG: T9SS type A sorting domain-containing protein, partial [Saprospiraceae bacterium]|nr:T9SS type A sorting domain-containing protein [Saprospiraceae bacterium]MDW8483980.1 T9SS type A sorting domain-containing protein [Saprospiraceae bacterium]